MLRVGTFAASLTASVELQSNQNEIDQFVADGFNFLLANVILFDRIHYK